MPLVEVLLARSDLQYQQKYKTPFTRFFKLRPLEDGEWTPFSSFELPASSGAGDLLNVGGLE